MSLQAPTLDECTKSAIQNGRELLVYKLFAKYSFNTFLDFTKSYFPKKR